LAEPVPAPPAPTCPVKIIVFTVKLLIGLSISQAIPGWLAPAEYDTWKQIVKLSTMFCLSYIMINVGYEFDIDKTKLRDYGADYGIAMTAAGFPWIFVAFWFVYALPDPLPWKEALVAARFAAPTSAGILFSMLEAAGMKETWLFQKARVLAIFDDLDTILLMVPLKVIIVGMKWELSIDLFFVIVLLGLSWFYLHAVKIPVSSSFTLFYAALVTTICELVHVVTHYHIEAMDTVHLEVLLPAFAIGCIARSGHAEDRHDIEEQAQASTLVEDFGPAENLGNEQQKRDTDAHPSSNGGNYENSHTRGTGDKDVHMEITVDDSDDDGADEQIPPEEQQQQQQQELSVGPQQSAMSRRASLIVEDVWLAGTRNLATIISAVFMVLVGLSMPALIGGTDEKAHRRRLASEGGSGSSTYQMPAGELTGHVVVVTVLMIVGKMFPTFCYRSEANLRTRFALSLGMCPRGEVGAGVIVISLGFGIEGSAITIAVISLAINLILSSGFIMAVKRLARESSTHEVPLACTPVVPFASASVVPITAQEFGPTHIHEDEKQVNAGDLDELNTSSTEAPVQTKIVDAWA